MNEKALNQRLLLIGAIVLLGIFFVVPPKKKLLPGLDIAGGTSLIFEIEEDPGENNPLLAEQMKTLLQRRVDPKGVYDLVWRVVGRNRLEVQMPLPPAENNELKNAFNAAREKLSDAEVKASQVEAVAALPAEQRDAELAKLLDDSAARQYMQTAYSGAEQTRKLARLAEWKADREQDLRRAVAAIDRYNIALAALQQALATQPATSAPDASQPAVDPVFELRKTLRDTKDERADALEVLMVEKAFDTTQFQDVLDMDETSRARSARLVEIKDRYPNLEPLIAAATDRFGKWREKRVLLEGSADLTRLLRGSGVLEFRILAEPSSDNATKYDRYREQLDRYGPRPQKGDTEGWFKIDNPIGFFNVKSITELNKLDPKTFRGPYVIAKRGSDWFVLSSLKPEDGLLHTAGKPWKLVRAGQGRDPQGRASVNFLLDAVGGSYFRELTRRNIQRQLCILVDDVAYSSANINSEIGTSGEIVGDFSAEKIHYLIQTMQAGSLPGKLKDTPISERTIGSSLGEENLRQAFLAGVIGLVAVFVVMVGYYWRMGMIANVAMLLNVLLVLAVMSMLGARFNLPGIAGIILGIGMAVDSNVLIYERMREEKARGGSLRMVIKNGYDKAFTTIFDSHVTALLTSAILYYAGSEEIKGFGLTLGWGIALNLFTSVFVTRVIFSFLVKYGFLTDVKMAKLIGVPNFDWYGKRRIFLTCSLAITIGGLFLLFLRGSRDTLDVEFLGGVNAEVQIKSAFNDKFDDALVTRRIQEQGDAIEDAGHKLSQATVTAVDDQPSAFRVTVPGVNTPLLTAMLAEPLETGESGKLLQPRIGIEAVPGVESTVLLRVKSDVTLEKLRDAIVALADKSGDSLPGDGKNIRLANVGRVRGVGESPDSGKTWSVTTVAANKKLVQYALVNAFGEALDTKPRISYTFHGSGDQPFPIESKQLSEVVPGLPPGVEGNLTDFAGGAAIQIDQMNPPQDLDTLRERLRNMRLQPDYADVPYRRVEVFGVTPAGAGADGRPLYTGVVVVTVDAKHSFADDAGLWASEFAMPELALVRAAFDTEQTLRKVTSFKPQIADQARNKALIAVALSWVMIIAYMWVRFGKMRYGVAGVVALVHDVCVALAFVGISGWIGGHNSFAGKWLLIEDFKIDMTIVAAIMTIIGFSINDTIVIFDRVREMKGRLGRETIKVVNDSINQTLARTILTTGTVLITLFAMYIFGGSAIRGFTFCMLVGCITGAYSTLAIASPLLLFGMVSKQEEQAATRSRLALA
jgi:SecD/SecF fusion protein